MECLLVFGLIAARQLLKRKEESLHTMEKKQ